MVPSSIVTQTSANTCDSQLGSQTQLPGLKILLALPATVSCLLQKVTLNNTSDVNKKGAFLFLLGFSELGERKPFC